MREAVDVLKEEAGLLESGQVLTCGGGRQLHVREGEACYYTRKTEDGRNSTST